jgi:hopanoid biosynthesis associated protein HpnK
VKKLIVTGDDFGFSLQVNEAIEEAHRHGILSCASLMVGAKATADAVERAKRLSSLRVGLHLVLVDGSPVLPPETIPNLVDGRGRFSSHLLSAGINFFFQQEVRQQLEAEIRAQFQGFQKTALPMDHVNAHHHLHLHPTVSSLLFKVGREYGMKAVRFPYEPPIPSWRASGKGLPRRFAAWLILFPWVALLKRRLRRAKVHANDFVFGMNDSGHVHLDLVLRFLKFLPQGVTEIYFHPGDDPNELAALTSPAMQQALLTSQIETITFCDLY